MITGKQLREMFPNGTVMALEYAYDISMPSNEEFIHPGVFHQAAVMDKIISTMDMTQPGSLKMAAIRFLAARITSITG